jgi:hypothetical protein
MSSKLIEHELAENTFGALCKYAKHILLFHLDGVAAEAQQAVDISHPLEENPVA